MKYSIQSAMQEYLSFELFMHYKSFFSVNHCQSPRQGVKMAEGNCVGCESKMRWEEHATYYQQQDSSEEKENEEVAGTSADVELTIGDFMNNETFGCQSVDKN